LLLSRERLREPSCISVSLGEGVAGTAIDALTLEVTMWRYIVLIVFGTVIVGCKPADPIIEAERTRVHPGGGGFIGPVGGDYHHGGGQDYYKGPVSRAPVWAK
jgi:hypothetical protein